MRYPPDLLDEIRSRLPVSRVVERRVKLRRAGREYVGLSPFKTERTPSFTVNDQKGFYHCFASGEHGDIFTFLMKTEGLSFPEAIERLAAEAGVTLPEDKPQDEAKADREARARGALEEACRFFEAQLASRAGEGARAYLASRGVQADEIAAFRLGYAPDSRSALKSHLAAKGYAAEEMQDAGLVIHGDDIPVSYDRFRGRLIFPITDGKRRVIAFGGRALLPDQQPKYLNSPETPLFHKGRVLFNMAAVREAARAAKSVIVAEGYMDVIALTKAGFAHAVAPLGTALTEDQLRLLWAMAPTPALCFDGDAAGQKAAHRALDVALPHLEPGRSLQFVFLPEGQDPDDMVRKGAKDELAALIERPVPLFEVLWRREEGRHPLESPEQRASFEDRLMELAGQIVHKTLKFHYISAIRERLRTRTGGRAAAKPRAPQNDWRARSGVAAGAGALRQKADRFGRSSGKESLSGATDSLLSSAAARPAAAPGAAREALLLKALVSHPWLLDEFAEEVAALSFSDSGCSGLRDEILAVHQGAAALDNNYLVDHLSRRGFSAKLEDIERAAAYHAEASFDVGAEKYKVLEVWRHIVALHNRAGSLERALREAEEDYLREQNGENFSRLCAIRQQVEFAIP